MATSHVIIGDGIAGSSAAETIREADPEASVTVLTEEGEALGEIESSSTEAFRHVPSFYIALIRLTMATLRAV